MAEGQLNRGEVKLANGLFSVLAAQILVVSLMNFARTSQKILNHFESGLLGNNQWKMWPPFSPENVSIYQRRAITYFRFKSIARFNGQHERRDLLPHPHPLNTNQITFWKTYSPICENLHTPSMFICTRRKKTGRAKP